MSSHREAPEIAKDPVATPQDALRSGKTIVLIANAVHGNETAGKEASQLVESSDPVDVAVDRDDAIVLGNAIAGHAEVLMTGDAKVLGLGQHGAMRIVSPRGFWEILQAKKSR